MKKIVMAAAAFCLAVGSQAASVDWTLARDDAKTWANADIYIVDASQLSNVIALFNAGGETVESTFLSTYAIGGAKADTANSRGAAGLSTEVGSATSLVYMIFENNTIASESKYFYTAATDVSEYLYTPPAEGPGALNMEATAFANSGTVAVPEPTSGLLLLLGVAGLALKRKRS